MSKVFVLRTHALLSSRRSTLKFGNDNEIVIPMAVLDELRALKKESFEKGRIARDLLEYINSFDTKKLMTEGSDFKIILGNEILLNRNYVNISCIIFVMFACTGILGIIQKFAASI